MGQRLHHRNRTFSVLRSPLRHSLLKLSALSVSELSPLPSRLFNLTRKARVNFELWLESLSPLSSSSSCASWFEDSRTSKMGPVDQRGNLSRLMNRSWGWGDWHVERADSTDEVVEGPPSDGLQYVVCHRPAREFDRSINQVNTRIHTGYF